MAPEVWMSDDVELNPEIYAHLRALARRIHGAHGRGQVTLQPTVLLHEAWMKLDRSDMRFNSKAHFMATAARAMRQIIVDRARHKGSQKRGGDLARVTLSGVSSDPGQALDVLAIDEAITALEALQPRAAEVVLMRTFGGMSVAEIAEVLEITDRTVNRDWRFAKKFLKDQLSP